MAGGLARQWMPPKNQTIHQTGKHRNAVAVEARGAFDRCVHFSFGFEREPFHRTACNGSACRAGLCVCHGQCGCVNVGVCREFSHTACIPHRKEKPFLLIFRSDCFRCHCSSLRRETGRRFQSTTFNCFDSANAVTVAPAAVR